MRQQGRTPRLLDACGADVHALDMRATCKYVESMSRMIQIRNVPDDLHRTLKVRAAESGMTLSDYLLREIRHIAERPTPAEMRYRLSQRSPVRVRESSEDAVRAERDSR